MKDSLQNVLLALSVGLSLALVALAVLMVVTVDSFARVSNLTSQATHVQAVAPSQAAAEAVSEPVPVEAEAEPIAAPTVTQRAAEQVEAEPTPAPATVPFAAELTDVNIPESDWPIARQLLFAGDVWNAESIASCSCRKYTHDFQDSISRLRIIRFYVVNQHESWANALHSYETRGVW